MIPSESLARGIGHRADARHDRTDKRRRQLRHLFGGMWADSFHSLKS
jgi:hypothetical protein